MQKLDESIVADTGLLEFALAEGADPNARGPRDETPVHLAAKTGSVQAIEQLLAHGALPDSADDSASNLLPKDRPRQSRFSVRFVHPVTNTS